MSHFQQGGHDIISHKKCCRLVSENEASARRLCSSVCQFLVYSTFVLVLSYPLNLSVVTCVVVTPENYENVKNVVVYETTTLTCGATYDKRVVWYFEQFCDDFEHGLYFCSSPAEIAIGHQYQIRITAPGEHSLLINAVTMNMTGLYSCRNRERQAVIDRVLLNVMCKYNFMLFSSSVFCHFSSLT